MQALIASIVLPAAEGAYYLSAPALGVRAPAPLSPAVAFPPSRSSRRARILEGERTGHGEERGFGGIFVACLALAVAGSCTASTVPYRACGSHVKRSRALSQREASEGAPLLIVGAGVLGRLAASEWRDARGDETGEVIGVTRTNDETRSETMRAEGIEPRLRSDVDAEGVRYPYVLFCASPGGNKE